MGGVRLAEREVETARRPASGAGNSFLHPVRRVWFASGVEFDRGIEKTGFLNIHEAQNAKTWGRSFGRTGGRGREPAGAEDGEFVFVYGAPHLVRVLRRVRPRDRKNPGFLVQNEY